MVGAVVLSAGRLGHLLLAPFAAPIGLSSFRSYVCLEKYI